MKCPKCQHENPDGSKFCEQCGEPLDKQPRFCPKCGVELSANVSFCPNCGCRVSANVSKNTSAKSGKQPSNQGNSNVWKIVAVVAAIAVIGFGVWKFLFANNKVLYTLAEIGDGNKELVATVKGKQYHSKIQHPSIEIGEISEGDKSDQIEIKTADGLVDDSKTIVFDKATHEFYDDAKRIKFNRNGNKIIIYEDVVENQNGKEVKWTKQTVLGSVKIVFDSPRSIGTDTKCDNQNYDGLVVKSYDIDGDNKKDNVKFYQPSDYNSVVKNHAADIVIAFANGKKCSLAEPANFVCIMKSKSLGVSDIITTSEGFRNNFTVYHWNGNYYAEVPDADYIAQMERKANTPVEPEEFYTGNIRIGSNKYYYYPGCDGEDNQEKIFVETDDGKKYTYRVRWQDGGIVDVVGYDGQGFDKIIYNWNNGNTERQSAILFNRFTKNFTYLYDVPDKIEKSDYSNTYTVYYYKDSGTKKYTISDGGKNDLKEVKTSQSYHNYFDF